MDTTKIRNKFTEMSKIFKDVIDEYESLKKENESLKHQVEKHKEAYSLMCAEYTRRYDELMAEKKKLETKELCDALDAENSSKI